MLTGVEIVGLVSAVITFIDFAAENVAVAREIGKSGSAAAKGNADLERRIKLLDERIKNVYSCGLGSARDAHEAELLNLVDRYKDLAVQLLSLLADLKSTRKRDILRKSAKNMFKKGQKESLVQELDECRNAIHLQLTQVMRHDMNRRLEEISDQGHNHIAELRHLKKSTVALESSLGNCWQQVPGLAEEVRTIVRQASDAIDRNARKEILEELWVEGMEDRFEEIDEAHESTFNWILGDDDSSSNDDDSSSNDDDVLSDDDETLDDGDSHSRNLRRRVSPENNRSSKKDDRDDDEETFEETQARQKIINWLAHENGIFHISGKPGSGKSTLMKYLCQNAKTQDYLLSWAGDKTLITANFFFWRPGTTIQKSLDGLRRALLYTIMDEIPSLVQVGFPKQWSLAVEDRPCQIPGRDVDAALKLVLDCSDLWAAHKVAFFIDGLDEFDGDHDHMMKLLLRWVREYGDGVKLCVSSREWEIFRQRLAGCPGIRLQDITVRDIKSYVSHELSENEEFERFALTSPKILDLVEQITAKAEGVFLWVKITLRGLKWGLLSGERVEDLEERIDGLPTELEALYQSLFDSIRNGKHTNKLDRAKAMRTLLLALLYRNIDRGDHIRPSFLLISYSFLDDYTRDQDFSHKIAIQPIEKTDRKDRLDHACKMIYQRCMGFLETYRMQINTYDGRGLRRIPTPGSGETGDNRSSNTGVKPQTTENQKRVSQDSCDSLPLGFVNYQGRMTLMVDQISSQHPVRDGIRFIHRTALEFLSQSSVLMQVRDEAMQFNAVDFELQAIIASMKLFTPSVRYATRSFIRNLRHRLNHYLLMLGPIPEVCFQRFQGEAARTLRHYGLSAGYQPVFLSAVSDVVMLDPGVSLLLLATRTGASHSLSFLTGRELYRMIQYENLPKDIVLDSYLDGMCRYFDHGGGILAEGRMSGKDRAAYGQRIYRDVSAYLETGVSPNSVSNVELKLNGLTCWQAWLLCLLCWERVEELCRKFLELFLLHEADAEIWFWFSYESLEPPKPGFEEEWYWQQESTVRVWWPALGETSVRVFIGMDHIYTMSSCLSQMGTDDEDLEGWAISLGDMLPILFPQTGVRLKELASRSLGPGASPPPQEVWKLSEDSIRGNVYLYPNLPISEP